MGFQPWDACNTDIMHNIALTRWAALSLSSFSSDFVRTGFVGRLLRCRNFITINGVRIV